jgi:hypothetical protein
MTKVLFAGILGGIVLFVWSFAAWVVLPLHTNTIKPVPNEDAFTNVLRTQIPTKSVYIFPYNPGMGGTPEAQSAWAQKMERGPSGMLIINPAGTSPVMAGQMVVGMILNIFAALVVAWLLSRSTAANSSYFSRVAFCGMFGIFATFFDYLVMWNWMGFPTDFTSAMIVDALISWLLAGMVIARFIKPPALQPAT